jgi:hypothetical protein
MLQGRGGFSSVVGCGGFFSKLSLPRAYKRNFPGKLTTTHHGGQTHHGPAAWVPFRQSGPRVTRLHFLPSASTEK